MLVDQNGNPFNQTLSKAKHEIMELFFQNMPEIDAYQKRIETQRKIAELRKSCGVADEYTITFRRYNRPQA